MSNWIHDIYNIAGILTVVVGLLAAAAERPHTMGIIVAVGGGVLTGIGVLVDVLNKMRRELQRLHQTPHQGPPGPP